MKLCSCFALAYITFVNYSLHIAYACDACIFTPTFLVQKSVQFSRSPRCLRLK